MFGNNVNKYNDDEVLKAARDLKKGSAEAFHILYTKYQNKVYRFCLRLLEDEALAKDAFQETFIRIYEHRQEFHGESFTAWLFTIARHTCLNQIRTRKEHESFDEFYHGYRYEGDSDVAMKDQIENAIKILPVAMKEALLLREYEELSYKEVADILGIDESLAKVRVHRARIILRKLLKPVRKELYES
jgi:RNA polymerase sigma-70 factor (ECF subfamily)